MLQNFRNLFRELNITTRNLGEEIENWNYQKLDETNRAQQKLLKKKYNYKNVIFKFN